MLSKLPATGLFVQLFVQANNKETSNLRITDTLLVSNNTSNAENIPMAWHHQHI